MHRTLYRLCDGLIEIIQKIKTQKERQGDYFSKWEGRRGYLLLHHVFSPQKKQSLEHTTRYSLGATSESELNWGIKSPFSQHRESGTNSEPPFGGNWQQHTAFVTTMPMEIGLGTAAYGRGDKYLPGYLYTYTYTYSRCCNALPHRADSGASFL